MAWGKSALRAAKAKSTGPARVLGPDGKAIKASPPGYPSKKNKKLRGRSNAPDPIATRAGGLLDQGKSKGKKEARTPCRLSSI